MTDETPSERRRNFNAEMWDGCKESDARKSEEPTIRTHLSALSDAINASRGHHIADNIGRDTLPGSDHHTPTTPCPPPFEADESTPSERELGIDH